MVGRLFGSRAGDSFRPRSVIGDWLPLFDRPSAIKFFSQADDLSKQDRQFLGVLLQP